MIYQRGRGEPWQSAHSYNKFDEAHTACVGSMHVLRSSADAAVYLQNGQVPEVHTTRYHHDTAP